MKITGLIRDLAPVMRATGNLEAIMTFLWRNSPDTAERVNVVAGNGDEGVITLCRKTGKAWFRSYTPGSGDGGDEAMPRPLTEMITSPFCLPNHSSIPETGCKVVTEMNPLNRSHTPRRRLMDSHFLVGNRDHHFHHRRSNLLSR